MVLIRTSWGSGGQPVGRCSIESLEEATDNHSRMLTRSDVRSNTCTKLEHVFERVKHHYRTDLLAPGAAPVLRDRPLPPGLDQLHGALREGRGQGRGPDDAAAGAGQTQD